MFRLDFIANFLSRPILNGYLNGLAISIIVGQFGKVFGYDIQSGGIFKMLFEFFSKISQTHLITMVIGVTAFVSLRLFRRVLPKLPAPLILVAIGILIVNFLGLQNQGVRVVGSIPPGLPYLGIPVLDFHLIDELILPALGMVLICYCSLMLTNKSFASKNGYEIDANQDFYALGIANISSGLSQGFVISGADSRTAVADSSGGKTQLMSIVAAITIILVLLFLTEVFTFLPITILGAIVISASIGLFNFQYLKRLYLVNKGEFLLAVITSLGVLTIGVLPAVILAIALALGRLVAKASKPHDAILGKVENIESYQDITEFTDTKTFPGLLIYRFDASILFFNADYFRNRIRTLIKQSKEKIDCVLLDAESIVYMDITGLDILTEMESELARKGIRIFIARAKKDIRDTINKAGLDNKVKTFDSVRSGVDYYFKDRN